MNHGSGRNDKSLKLTWNHGEEYKGSPVHTALIFLNLECFWAEENFPFHFNYDDLSKAFWAEEKGKRILMLYDPDDWYDPAYEISFSNPSLI